MGIAYRQASQFTLAEAERERVLVNKQRGIMRRIVDSSSRLAGMGFNKLIEEWKANQNNLKNKLKFVIKALTDQDSKFILSAYNGLKERMMLLNGVGLGDSQMKKVNL